MRWAEFFFALSFGLGLPCLPAAFGVRLPQAQVMALVILGVSLGTCIPAALDILTRLTREDELSLIRQREANTRATELANLEREARLAVAEPEADELGQADPFQAERRRDQQVSHWHVFYRRLFAAATAYGWDIRTLTDKHRPTRVMTQPAWNLGTDQLVLARFVRKDQSGGTVPLVSEAEWQDGRLWQEVPCPSGEPPEIANPPYTMQQTPHKTTAKQAVIDG